MQTYFAMFAAYNQWANQQVYAAVADLTVDEFERDTGLFFKSIMGTLNHLLAGDRVWQNRFTGTGPAPRALDEIQHREFAPLRAARVAEDQRIIGWVGTLTSDALDGAFSYVPLLDPSRTITQRLGPALAHFFNHQTHHRGQVHAALTGLGKPSLLLDLIYFQRTDEGRAFA